MTASIKIKKITAEVAMVLRIRIVSGTVREYPHALMQQTKKWPPRPKLPVPTFIERLPQGMIPWEGEGPI